MGFNNDVLEDTDESAQTGPRFHDRAIRNRNARRIRYRPIHPKYTGDATARDSAAQYERIWKDYV
jgi:hypothetical protein